MNCFCIWFVTLLMTPPDAGVCRATKYYVLPLTWKSSEYRWSLININIVVRPDAVRIAK